MRKLNKDKKSSSSRNSWPFIWEITAIIVGLLLIGYPATKKIEPVKLENHNLVDEINALPDTETKDMLIKVGFLADNNTGDADNMDVTESQRTFISRSIVTVLDHLITNSGDSLVEFDSMKSHYTQTTGPERDTIRKHYLRGILAIACICADKSFQQGVQHEYEEVKESLPSGLDEYFDVLNRFQVEVIEDKQLTNALDAIGSTLREAIESRRNK